MKRLTLFCFLSFLAVVLIFHKTLLTFLFGWGLQIYTTHTWGKPLQHGGIYLEGKQFIILQPRLDHEPSFSAEQAKLNFHLDWQQKQLYIDVNLDQPHWHFQTPVVIQEKHLKKWFTRKSKWIKTQPSFHVQQGLLTWSIDQPHHLFFDLDFSQQEGGSLKLYSDLTKSHQEYAIFTTSTIPHEIGLSCQCQHMHCVPLIALAELWGVQWPFWQITEGALQGDLKMLFPQGQKLHFEGDIFAEHMSFVQEDHQLKGHIEQIHLKIDPQFTVNEQDETIVTSVGQLEILKPASLVYRSGNQETALNQIQGKITLDATKVVHIALDGQSDQSFYTSHWNLQGNGNLNARRALNWDLTLSCSAAGEPKGKMHFVLFRDPEEINQTEIRLDSLSYQECHFLQSLLASYWPLLNEVQLEQGVINASVQAHLSPAGIQKFHVKQFQTDQLSFYFKPWNSKTYFEQVILKGSAHLSDQDLWQSLQAEIHLQKGNIHLEGMSPSLPLTEIQADVVIHNGLIEHSLINLQLAGLKGNLDIEWGDAKQMLALKLDGKAQDLVDFIPTGLQEGVRRNFFDNHVLVLATIKKQNQQVELGGTLHVQKEHTDQMDLIHFGCELKKFKEESAIRFVPFGWFYAYRLPLEKFISPFVSDPHAVQMHGEVEVKGSFDDQFFTLKYDVENLKIENEALCMEAKSLHSSIPGQFAGFHQIDLKTYAHQGTLSLQQASYLVKNKGLLFTDIQGMIAFEDQKLCIEPLESYCEGMYFAGKLNLDYSDPTPGLFDLTITCPTLVGKVSQFQHLLAHLDPTSSLLTLPLEGQLALKEKGLNLRFAFNPNNYTFDADIQGAIVDGYLPLEWADMTLKGLDITVCCQQQALTFSDIQGVVLVGKPRRVEEYLLTGHSIHVSTFNQPQLEWDLAIQDEKQELFRLVGSIQPQEDLQHVYLDPHLSHVSALYLQRFQCVLKNWTTLEHLDLHSVFDVEQLRGDLQKFRRTGLGCLSAQFLEQIASLDGLEGKGSLSLAYDPSEQAYRYQVEGFQLKQGDQEHSGFLKGHKQGKKWVVDHLKWDQWSVYAEIQQEEDKWKIPFLGVNAEEALLLGLEGEFYPDDMRLRAKLNLCEMDLATLDRWRFFQAFVAHWRPEGVIRTTGQFEWVYQADSSNKLNAILQAETDQLKFRNYPVHILKPFEINIQNDQSFEFKNMLIALNAEVEQPHLHVQTLHYRPQQEEWHCAQLDFHLPVSQSATISEELQQHFPDFIDDGLKEILINAKTEGEWHGKFAFHLQGDRKHFHLKLEDGLYHFKKRAYDLKQFEIQIKDQELQFMAFAQEAQCPFELIGHLQWPSCQKGTLTLLDKTVQMGQEPPLRIQWEDHPTQGWMIQTMQGYFSGCTFQLANQSTSETFPDWTALQGQIQVDFNQLCPLLPTYLAEKIQHLKVGSLYHLDGKVWWNPKLSSTFLDSVFFQGQLTSQNAILKGYQVNHVQSEVQYRPGRWDMQKCVIQDEAGQVNIDELTILLDAKTNEWSLFMPRLTVKHFKPYLLRDAEDPSAALNVKWRALIVKRIELEGFSGKLQDAHTWQAQGSLYFLNPSRKNFQHPLLAIPAEIILRLGLDPHVLNPVTGTIYFDLQEGRFYLKRFKDVYSEGRGSKFYLAQGPAPSWMDFDGNLSVQIRMKQYNLIFKLAELFTVSIQGNLKKPRYTLQKQAKASHQTDVLSVNN